MSVLRAIGLMSGTSLDGVDVALIETDGERRTTLRASGYRPYTDEERALLRLALADGATLTSRHARPGVLAEAEALITRAHAEAVEGFMAEQGLSRAEIDVVGFHGQTVLHRPERALTVQIGDGPALAARLGIPVIHDLRAADMAAGGQGAPLVPVFHRALAESRGMEAPLAVLNIGGVANVTLIGPDGELLAFDTGPGNALLDDLVRERTGRPFDEGGAIAAAGRPDEALLAWLLTHPYFIRRPPKSLDRNWFSHRIVAHLSTEDGAATLAAFTARSVTRALDFVDSRPSRWIVGGGGALNGEILRLLGAGTGAEVVTADSIGWSAAALEAQAFGFLAVRSLKGLPITYPSTTGAPQAMTGGVLARP
ncbi:anhydro-N-acetylmuramic acid kinase [Salinarimonas soli]|uniref:anhydro-N-acetylmuramic acid kinase n=1 Tax=Salinarimonas soli TaxID=1638099 RepID=UPI001F0B70D4|nr:anhydro-N-acetylmuramic acid kinase [Salinarimonas soli]